MFHLIWMFIIGIVVGLLARWVTPGADQMGLLMTGVVGIVASYIGGFIARIFSKPVEGQMFHPAGIIMSVIGAVVLLVILRYV